MSQPALRPDANAEPHERRRPVPDAPSSQSPSDAPLPASASKEKIYILNWLSFLFFFLSLWNEKRENHFFFFQDFLTQKP
jgi:hypothetical protein